MSDNDSSAIHPQESGDDDWLKTADLWWSQTLSEAGAGFRSRLDAEAKKPAKPSQAAPFTDFDQDFFAHTEPKLAGYVHLGGYLVGLGLESFSEAHDRVMRVARTLGASHLSDTAFWAFDAWIDQAILAMTDEPGPEGVITREQLAQLLRETP